MFLVAGIVGGIKGLPWSPAHIMRGLAGCLGVLQLPPGEAAQALKPIQLHPVVRSKLPLIMLPLSVPICS